MSRSRGRRPGPTSARTKIPAASRELFAAKGYSGATPHGIDQRAQVGPALVHHFFDNRDDLCRETVSSRLDMSPSSARTDTGRWRGSSTPGRGPPGRSSLRGRTGRAGARAGLRRPGRTGR
ncbi:TetR/AcrR family transcriptional regulator [Streptomyces sp. NBC_00986]|uniref:TetR/AcrR family transcriptional regulator n=1 Tax=Streptomyces sp. NBC_00986 TaxID=2903702 RepID=UPI003863F720